MFAMFRFDVWCCHRLTLCFVSVFVVFVFALGMSLLGVASVVVHSDLCWLFMRVSGSLVFEAIPVSDLDCVVHFIVFFVLSLD